MKTIVIFVSVLVAFILLSFWFYSNKAYYPTLPFEGVSKKEVVKKLGSSNNELVELAKVDGFYWLGFRGNQQEGRNNVIKAMEDRGLVYESYDGAGLFFKNKNNERIIVTGKMWTGDYVLYKIPAVVE
ncbi:hypothetical protein [Paenibacillus alkalitolerans]|uniref:hypothetical protein n=1 Tax=Paenibacillus alkalitolerans TaxID=2799335 RepID=UPI0018F73DAE|nr:hypothetical protein [Paenibacillus alkalitolerans]